MPIASASVSAARACGGPIVTTVACAPRLCLNSTASEIARRVERAYHVDAIAPDGLGDRVEVGVLDQGNLLDTNGDPEHGAGYSLRCDDRAGPVGDARSVTEPGAPMQGKLSHARVPLTATAAIG